jgi:hypothetical protein
MTEISLVVTRAEVAHAETHPKERQIAIRSPSPDVQRALGALSSTNRMHLRLGDFVTLDAADPGAVWLAHNDHHRQAFEALYALLATKPDREMRFLCDLSPLPPVAGEKPPGTAP